MAMQSSPSPPSREETGASRRWVNYVVRSTGPAAYVGFSPRR